jgi:citrate lyase alpha subunit
MPRKKKTDVKVNSTDSLEGLMQETYNDACLQISDAQKTINELSSSVPQTELDVDDLTKIAKEKAGLLKVKESGIRIKLELAKLQSDIIKNKGDVDAAVGERTGSGSASLNDFKLLREALKNDKDINNGNAEEFD